MRNIICLVFVLCALGVTAQNYQPYSAGREYYFSGPDAAQGLFGMRADSVTLSSSDTVFHHARLLTETGTSSCTVRPDGPPWTGLRSIRRANQNHIFLTHLGDSLVLKPAALPGEVWTFYHFLVSGDVLEARVEEVHHQNLGNGVSDSVKTIRLTRRAYNGTVVSGPWNQRKILLSKNHGFVRVFDLHLFPIEGPDYLFNPIKPFTQGEIFDFEPGDVFHYYIDESKRLPPPSTNWWPPGKYVVHSVFGKTAAESQHAVTYHVWEQIFRITGTGNEARIDTVETGRILTLHYDQLNKRVFSALPSQAENTTTLLNYRLFADWKQSRRPYISFCLPEYEQVTENCWQALNNQPRGCYTYIKGAGLLMDEHYGNGKVLVRHLYYFKKGSEKWGVPFDVLRFGGPETPPPPPLPQPDLHAWPIYTYYPNPVQDWMRIEILLYTPEKIKISIMDMLGNVVYYREFNHSGSGTETVPIDFSGTREGMYILVLESQHEKVTKKLVRPW